MHRLLPSLWVVFSGCVRATSEAAPSPVPATEEAPVSDHTIPATWRAWLTLSEADVLAKLELSSAEGGASYGPTSELSTAHAPAHYPGRFYFQGDKVVLITVMGEAVQGLEPASLARSVMSPRVELGSRAGKRFTHHIVPSAGIAWSDDGEEVAFVELFPPCSGEAYRARWYEEPGTFRK